ncbi:MAG: hypothetical protein QGG09_11985, partial [Pirellulaceae bacterium]|nr:hypothetical protein [Pirellulaceae bacterium]
IRARRTYAATGDRIVLEVSLNGQPMGSDVAKTADREIDIRVEAQDSIAMIELVRNGRVIQRHFPEDYAGQLKLPGRAKCRVQYGWGPWAALDLGRTCEWDMSLRLNKGRFLQAVPCYQSGPYEEEMRDRLRVVSEKELRLQSFTSRVKCYAEDPAKAVVCEVEGGPDSLLTLQLRKPVEQTVEARLADLAVNNVVTFTGVFTSESYIVNRLVGPTEYATDVRWTDQRSGDDADWYYVRVTQHNGQLAWSSPIWVG